MKVPHVLLVLLLSGMLLPLRSLAGPVVVPVRMAGKLLIVEATVDHHRHGAFILDTGSSELILNSQYFHGDLAVGTTAIGANSNVERVEMQSVHFQLGELEWKSIKAAILDLQYLEQEKGLTILGLIGGSVLQNLELVIDFGRLQVEFYPLDERGERLSQAAADPPTDVFPLVFKNKVPCLSVTYAGRRLTLGLDSASEINLLRRDMAPCLEDCLIEPRRQAFRGVSGQVSQAIYARVKSFVLGSAGYYSMPTVFTDLRDYNRFLPGPELDGLLGFDFLAQYKTAINFKKGELYIWNNRPRADLNELLAASCQ